METRHPKSVLGAGHTGTNTGLARPTIPDHRGRAGAQQEAHCTEEARGALEY